jgi:AcrR family transcriptional regulator
MVAARPEADVRTRILHEATRLFAERGFDGTTLQDIADAVGVTKQAVLHHFPSKELVREAVLGALLAHWKDTLPRLLLAATASQERFDAVFGELLRFFASDPSRARVVMREALDRPAEMRRLLVGPVKPWVDAVASYVRVGQETGRHFADLDPEAYVLHILQLVLAAAASAPVTSAVLEGDGRGDPMTRYDRELARIARASVFANTSSISSPPPATRARARAGTRPKRKTTR